MCRRDLFVAENYEDNENNFDDREDQENVA